MFRNLLFTGFCCVAIVAIGAFVVPDTPNLSPEMTHEVTTTNASGEAKEASVEEMNTVIDAINRQFETAWQEQGLKPAWPADDWLVMRRLTLAMIGTVPSIEDMRRIGSIPQEQRIEWWTSQILADRRHADYFAERLARAYVGVEEGPFLVYRRRRFVAWLSDQLHENVSYNQLVRDLITSNGLWTDSPAVNFLTITLDNTQEEGRPNPIRLAGRTTRAFLGVRLDCMQCHDDNLDGQWLQSDFHELAAFFSDPKTTLTGMHDKERDYEYQYLDQDETTKIEPGVPFARQALEAKGSRRSRLAHWITSDSNDAFARAIVNRVWALAYGRPLVDPIDSIPLEGPFPPGMETLAADFVGHGYDLKRLWRIVTSLRPFRLDSRSETHEITSAHETYWAAFPITRLRPEQVAGALVQSAKLATIDPHSHILVRLAKFGQTNDFVKRYGDMGEDEFNGNGGTIPQRLVVLNGKLIKELTEDNVVGNAATRIAHLAKDDSHAIDAAYQAILTRYPTYDEKWHFLERLANVDNRQEFFEDLYWVLYNSTEFSWNH